MRISDEQIRDVEAAITDTLDWSEVDVSVRTKRRGEAVEFSVLLVAAHQTRD